MDRAAFLKTLDRYVPEAYTCTGDPVEVSDSDLGRVLDDLRREARRIPALVGLYVDEGVVRTGPRSIRLIAVYDAAKCEPGSLETHDLLRTVGTRNILHPVVLALEERFMLQLPKVDCLLRPVHVAGKEIQPQSFQAGEMRFYYLSRLLDLMAGRWLQPLVEAEVRRRVDTQQTLVALQDLCRVVEIAKVIMRREHDGVPAWDTFVERIRRLCEVWFQCGLERYRALLPLIREGLVLAYELIGDLDTYCTRARVVNLSLDAGAQPPQALVVTDEATTAFVNDWTPARGLELALRSSEKLDRFVSVLPLSFCLQLYEYSKGKSKFPTFSRFVQSVFGTDGVAGNMERSYVSWERGELLEGLVRFYSKIGAREQSGYTFWCNIRTGSAISAAASLMYTHRNTSRLRGDMKTLKDVFAEQRMAQSNQRAATR